MDKLKKTFINKHFLIFIIIGVINTFNGVVFALIYSKFILNPVIAYIVGFFTSLLIAYILNSIFNFKEKINFTNLIKYVVNNIPNFIIQVLSVVVLIDMLELPKFYSYLISAVIAVPITFALVKVNVFKK